jgi:hypothetical protein
VCMDKVDTCRAYYQARLSPPRFSQLMSDDLAAVFSCGCWLMPVGAFFLPPDGAPSGVGYMLVEYSLLGARSLPQGLPCCAACWCCWNCFPPTPSASGSQASCTDGGTPLEYPPDDAADTGRGCSMRAMLPSRWWLPAYCDTVGLPELTLLKRGLPSPSAAPAAPDGADTCRGGTVAESCVRRLLWLPLAPLLRRRCCIVCRSEYVELPPSEPTVVRFDEPTPSMFKALPPDQYLPQPELRRVLGPWPSGGGPRGFWLGVSTVVAKDTPRSVSREEGARLDVAVGMGGNGILPAV